MPLEPPVGGSSWCWSISEGSRLHFTMCPSPLSPFNCFLSLAAFISRAVTNKMFRTAAVIAALFIHLGIFCCSFQLNHEFIGHSFNPIRVIVFLILALSSAPSSSSWTRHTVRFLHVNGWLPFNFLKGKKLVALSLEGPYVAGTLGLWDNSIESSFSASLVALR